MTAIAPGSNQLGEFDEDARRAWTAYSERLRDLTGDEYELAEHESWALLQSELRRVERRRHSLSHTTT